jgi:pimeloyl-ACP methyl ester carboxylesterase
MSRILYLPGMGGNAGVSPALTQLDSDVTIVRVPGFDGEAGFEAPTSYLDWLVVACDALDAAGATAAEPVTLVGASVGGMLAAELAALRPELVAGLVLPAPFGIADESEVPARSPGRSVTGEPRSACTASGAHGSCCGAASTSCSRRRSANAGAARP